MVTTVAAAAATLTWVGASYLQRPQGQRRRCGRRRRGRPRGHHAGGRLRDRRRRARARPRRRRHLLRRHAAARSPGDRRRARRLLGPRRRRHVGRDRRRPVRGREHRRRLRPRSRATSTSSSTSSSRSCSRSCFCSVMTFVIIKAIDIVLGLRVDSRGRGEPAWTSRSTARRRTCPGRVRPARCRSASRSSGPTRAVAPATCPPPKRNPPDAFSGGPSARSLGPPRSTQAVGRRAPPRTST